MHGAVVISAKWKLE